MNSRKYPILLVLAVVGLSCVLVIQNREIADLERRIGGLQASQQQQQGVQRSATASGDRKSATPAGGKAENIVREQPAAVNANSSYQILRELEADSTSDPRSDVERLQELLADNPTEEEAAIACRFIFDKAADTQALPDYALAMLYSSQRNPDLKRVIAQVLSQRGNDVLLDDQIGEAQVRLKSADPKDRLVALNRLARIHSVHAVDVIAPSLQDPDSTVRLAALFALRDSGNQRHIGLAEPLTHDPDPSVSNLAGNVVSALRNLSSSARTSYSRADIEAELPPIANP